MQFTRLSFARRRTRHFVLTPYDTPPLTTAPPLTVQQVIDRISEEANVKSTAWGKLDEEESERLLRFLPRFVDECKELNIQTRRLSAYCDIKRSAGHRARRAIHERLAMEVPTNGQVHLDANGQERKLPPVEGVNENMKYWCGKHLYAAEY